MTPSTGPRTRILLVACAALAVLGAVALFRPANAGSAPLDHIEVSARPITEFQIGRDEKQFGPLEFVGGLELTANSRDFGAFSALRFTGAGGDFVGVADTGLWFFGRVVHDADQRPAGIENFRLARIADASGKTDGGKWEVDAEGLAVKDGIATVGFERNHRVSQFRIDPDHMGPAIRNLDFLVPAKELRKNRGFETVAYSPPNGMHRGGLVVVSEKSLDAQGNIFAAIIEGPNKGVFTVRRLGSFDITDGAFLLDGDLLLLERSFSYADGVKMRLRRISGDLIAKGAVADGPVLLEADMGYQIDNMEAMDVWRRADGAPMVSLLSDDNHSILQRNLYLEFILHED
jgi:hypothetical protein